MIKRYFFLAGIFMLFTSIYCQSIGDYRTKQSGQWNDSNSWERFNGSNWVASWNTGINTDKFPDQTNDSGRFFNVTIKDSHIINLTQGGRSCNNLIVEANAQLLSGSSGINRYINVFGNITNDGIIGNGSIYNVISFGINGNNCLISGAGTFDCSSIRKADVNFADTGVNLTIGMPINLRDNETVFYNSHNNSNFNIIINEGVLVTLTNPKGNVAIDGTNAKGQYKSGGHIKVSGTLNIANILYLSADNKRAGKGPYPCTITIEKTGKIKTGFISIIESNDDGHYFNMEPGAMLEVTEDTNAFINFSGINNYFNFDTNSTIIYSSHTNANVNILANDTFPYQHLLFSGNGNRLFEGNLTINGNLTNNLHSGQLQGISSPRINLKGNWVSDGAGLFDESGIEINFTGIGTQIVSSNSGYEEFDKIKVNNFGSVLMEDSVSVNDIILTNGNLKIKKGLSLSGNYTGSPSNFISFAGNNHFEVSGIGTITDFLVSQDTTGITNRVRNLTVNKSSNDFTLKNELQISQLISHSNGNINSNGFLKLISSSETDYAQISGTGNGDITGNIQAQFTIPHSRSGLSGRGEWIQLGSPLNNVTLADIHDDVYVNYGTPTSSYQTAFYFSDPDINKAGGWRPAVSTDNMDERGYALFIPSDSNLSTNDLLTITGTYEKGNFTTSALTKTGNFVDSSGFHLLANPWPSSYDHNGAAINHLQSNTIYLYHGDRVKSHNGTTGTFNGVVPPFHAFYVEIDSNNNMLTFDASQRTIDHQNTYFNKKNPLDNILRLYVNGKSGSDEAILYADAKAKNGWDFWDVKKRINTGKVPNLFYVVDSQKTVIQLISEFSQKENMSFPLGFSASENGVYKINLMIEAFQNVNTKFYIEDLLLNQTTEITSNGYTYSHDNQNKTNRFILHLKNKDNTNFIQKNNSISKNHLIYNGKEILIKNPSTKAIEMLVFDNLGRQILSKKFNQNSFKINTQNLAKGMYYVKINAAEETFVKKIIVY